MLEIQRTEEIDLYENRSGGNEAVQTNSMGRHIHGTSGVQDVHSEFAPGRIVWRWAAILFCVVFWAAIVWLLLK